MHLVLAACCSLLLAVAASPGSPGTPTCAGRGFVCTGGARVQQCVDGVAQGPELPCGEGFLCDAGAEPGPCVPAEPSCCAEGTFAVPGNCRRFTICVMNGVRLLQFDGSCAPGFEFSARKLHCLPLEVAGCSVPEPSTTMASITTPITTTKTLSDPTIFECPNPGQFADPGSCSHYMVCTWKAGGGLQASRTACTTNLVYDTALRQCVYSTNCGSRPRR